MRTDDDNEHNGTLSITFRRDFIGVFFQLGNKKAIHIVSVREKSLGQLQRRMKMSSPEPRKRQ